MLAGIFRPVLKAEPLTTPVACFCRPGPGQPRGFWAAKFQTTVSPFFIGSGLGTWAPLVFCFYTGFTRAELSLYRTKLLDGWDGC